MTNELNHLIKIKEGRSLRSVHQYLLWTEIEIKTEKCSLTFVIEGVTGIEALHTGRRPTALQVTKKWERETLKRTFF